MTAFSATGAMRVNYYQIPRKEYGLYVASALALPMSLVLVGLLGVIFFPSPLAHLLGLEGQEHFLWFIPLLPAINIIVKVSMDLFRLEERHWHFAAFNFGISVLEISLSLLFVVSLGWGWEGRLWGITIATSGFLLVALYYLKRAKVLKFNTSKKFIRDAFRFGLPLVPFAISRQVIHSSDRIFIAKMEGLADTGIYNVGYRVGSLVAIVIGSLISALAPYVFKTLKNATPELKLKLVRIFYLFVGALVVLVGLTLVGSEVLFGWVLDKKYFEGKIYVFWVALSFVFHGVFEYFQLFIRFAKNTKPLFWISIIGMVLNLIFNYFFIEHYGVIGAAYATCLSYLIAMLLIFRASPRVYPMPWLKVKKSFKSRP